VAPALAQASIAEAIAPDTLCRVPALAGPGKTTPLPRAAQRLAARVSCPARSTRRSPPTPSACPRIRIRCDPTRPRCPRWTPADIGSGAPGDPRRWSSTRVSLTAA